MLILVDEMHVNGQEMCSFISLFHTFLLAMFYMNKLHLPRAFLWNQAQLAWCGLFILLNILYFQNSFQLDCLLGMGLGPS